MINYLKNIFPDKLIGFSDHTYPDDEMRVLVTAYTKGARVIEKHFTDNKKLKGNDHFHSLDCVSHSSGVPGPVRPQPRSHPDKLGRRSPATFVKPSFGWNRVVLSAFW